MFFTKSVLVKMLPFDNKNEFQVVIDMPEGTTLERTAVVAREIGQYLRTQPEVVNYQAYVGTSAPISFNGLVRHYDLRGGSNMADIQVNLTDKHDRSEQSHDLAKAMRPGIQEIAAAYGANVKLVEVPPGPPVLSTIVAEIYGPDYDQQIALADQVTALLRGTTDVVDVDWMVEAEQTEYDTRYPCQGTHTGTDQAYYIVFTGILRKIYRCKNTYRHGKYHGSQGKIHRSQQFRHDPPEKMRINGFICQEPPVKRPSRPKHIR